MEKKEIGKRKAQAIETKKKIYESAEHLFKKYGFDHVSVDAIVELSGVAKGSFYVHFDSKNALITALIADYVNGLDLDYKSYLESFPAGTLASEMLRSLVVRIADVITSTVGYENMKTLYEVQLTRTINTDAVLGYAREIYRIFSNILKLGIQQGDFKAELPVEIVANHCVLSLRGLTYEWCVRYPDFNLTDHTQKHFEILLSGIKK